MILDTGFVDNASVLGLLNMWSPCILMTYENEYGDYIIPKEVLEEICGQGRDSQVRNQTVPEYDIFDS